MIELFQDPSNDAYAFFDDDGSIVELPTVWLASLSGTHSPQSIDHYANVGLYFMRHIQVNRWYPGLPMDEVLSMVARGHIEAYLNDSRNMFTGDELEASTKRNRELILKNLFDFAATAKARFARRESDSPWSNGKYITKGPEQGLPKALTESQFIALLNGYHNECERCLVHAAFDLGTRVSEAARSLKKHLPNPDDAEPGAKYYLMLVLGAKGRGGQIRERMSLLSVPVYNRILHYHNNDDVYFEATYDQGDEAPMFLTVNGLPLIDKDGHPKDSLLNKQMDAAARRAGLDPEMVHFQVMRHCCALTMLASDHYVGKGANSKLRALIRENFGHLYMRSGDRYVKMSLAQMVNRNPIDRAAQAQRIIDATLLPYGKNKADGKPYHREHRGHRVR